MKKSIIFTGMFIKTLLVICAVALVPTVIVGTIGMALFSKDTIAKNYVKLDSITAGKIRTLDYTLDEIQRHSFAISLNSDAKRLLAITAAGTRQPQKAEYERTRGILNTYLNDVLLSSGGLFENLSFFDLRGSTVAAAVEQDSPDRANQSWFIKAAKGIANIYELAAVSGLGRQYITVAIPVRQERAVIGVFTATVDLLDFIEPLVSVDDLRTTLQYSLCADDGTILAATDKNTIGLNPSQSDGESFKIFNYMSENPVGNNSGLGNSDQCFSYAKFDNLGWYFITAENAGVVLQSVHEFRLFIMLILAVLAVFIFFLALAYSKSVAREARETTTALFESNPQAAFIFSEAGKVIDCNPAALEFYETASAEKLMERYETFWPAKQPGGKKSADFFRERFEEVLNNGYAEFDCMQRIKSKNVYLSIIAKRIHYNNAHAVALYQIDLTQHREVERALLQKDHLLEAVSHIGSRLLLADGAADNSAAIQDALRIFGEAKGVQNVRLWRHYQDKDGALCGRVIDSWEKNLKYHIDQTCNDINYQDFFGDSAPEILNGKKINGIVKNLPSEDQKIFTHIKGIKSVLLSPIIIKNKPWGFITVCDYESEHLFTEAGENALETTGVLLASSFLRNEANAELIKAKEAAMASTRAKSEFLSRMSHEIRTPLNVVIGMAKIAEKSGSIEKTRYCLNKIDEASRTLLSIINDVLDMSKIEADKFELSEEEFAFEKTIEHVCTIISIKSEEKHQNLIVNIERGIPPLLIGDEIRLTQVLTNLLFNAIKFTGENGTIKITVKKERQEGEYITLKFAVSDTGIGIKPEQIGKLFNSFEQADGSISRKFGGTGLGLSICKKIVSLMGGDISIESEYGRGSTFLFAIKLAVSPNNAALAEENRITVNNLNILAVDDSSDIREYFTQVMEGFRLSCDTAKDGFEALEMLRKKLACGGRYDLIFVDWKMPGLDGIETARQVKELTSDDTVIIMISVVEWSEIKEQALAAGIHRFVQKPLFSSSLLDVIHECFDIKSVKQQQQNTGEYDFSGKTVLLAEDVEINREIFISLVEETRLAVDCAENGFQAIEKFSNNPEKYDLILMDIHMPEVDGYTAAAEIRSLHIAKAETVPIVAMTANAFKEDIDRCIEAGMNDHIAKPLESEIVFAKLQKYLQPQLQSQPQPRQTGQTQSQSPQEKYRQFETDIHIEEGIQRLMGKEKVYLSLLKGFDAKNMAALLLEKSAAGNTEELKVFLHTLKGIAANLSLRRVADIAKQYETALKEGETIGDYTELENALLRIDSIIHKELQL